MRVLHVATNLEEGGAQAVLAGLVATDAADATRFQRYACGTKGLPKGVKPGPDTATFPSVDTETEYGWTKKVKLKVPIFTGALGSTEIAHKNWEHFAIGTAISGMTLVCGENVCDIDPQLVLDKDGKVKSSPEMDRRIETYKHFHEGYGEILAQ